MWRTNHEPVRSPSGVMRSLAPERSLAPPQTPAYAWAPVFWTQHLSASAVSRRREPWSISHLIELKDARRARLQYDSLEFGKRTRTKPVNHHHRKVLHAIFAHPVNANLDLKDVTNLLIGLGAEIDSKTKSRIGVTLNGQTAILHLTNHSLMKAEVMQIRKFLEFVRDYGGRLSGVA